MITDRQTNKVFFSKRLTCYKAWPTIKSVLETNGVDYILMNRTKAIWARDYMPIQVEKDRFVSYVYNPDYLQEDKDTISDWRIIPELPPMGEVIPTNLIIDGGNVVKCEDKVIMTDKVFLENRRLQLSKREVMDERHHPSLEYSDIWDYCGHTDGMVRHVSGNTVLLNNLCNHPELSWQRKEILDIFRERGIDCVELDYGSGYHGINDWAYLNFLQVGDTVFMPTVDKPETDTKAMEQLSSIYKCKVIPVPMLSIVKANGKYGGGALNCISWNIRT